MEKSSGKSNIVEFPAQLSVVGGQPEALGNKTILDAGRLVTDRTVLRPDFSKPRSSGRGPKNPTPAA